jgi:hypothetical protein
LNLGPPQVGAWLSLVERFVRVEEVVPINRDRPSLFFDGYLFSLHPPE